MHRDARVELGNRDVRVATHPAVAAIVRRVHATIAAAHDHIRIARRVLEGMPVHVQVVGDQRETLPAIARPVHARSAQDHRVGILRVDFEYEVIRALRAEIESRLPAVHTLRREHRRRGTGAVKTHQLVHP